MREWWNGMECLIRKHDAHQFEIKLAYPLNREHVEDRYRLEMFLFLPYQLGVNEGRYLREDFYHDLHGYVRFKTPPMTLGELVDETTTTSPVWRLRKWGDDARDGKGWDETRTVYEIKVLADIIRARVRDEGRHIRGHLEATPGPEWEAARDATERLAGETERALEAMRGVVEHWSGVAVPARVAETQEWADEYVNAEVEDLLLRVIAEAQDRETGGEGAALRARLAGIVRSEAEYRRSRGWKAREGDDDRRRGRGLYRQSQLKKFCAGALFLSVFQQPGDKRFRQLMYGIAAGVAMAFATGVALLAGHRWPNQSIGFTVALVVAYVFKDRIKEAIREYGMRLAPKWVCDRKSGLVDRQSGLSIGETRERFGWENAGQTPKDVAAARLKRTSLDRVVSHGVEQVIHYTKEVRIDTGAVYQHHVRSLAINDILRMSVSGWLDWMDNAHKETLHLEADGRVSRRHAPRIYPADIVLKMTDQNGESATIKAARLILTRDGIVRISRRKAQV